METADTTTLSLDERLVPAAEKSQRAFRAALVVAVLLHAAFFIEIGRSVPRSIGDPSGAQDAIAVELVTDADLRSREIVASPPAGSPTPPPSVAQPEPEPAPEPPQPPAPEAQPETPPQQTTEAPPPAPAPKDATQDSTKDVAALPDFESFAKDLATTPQPKPEAKAAEPETKPVEATEPSKVEPQPEAKKTPEPAEKQKQAAPAKKKPTQQAKLDLRLPDAASAPPGRSAAASRPPGITRSGENDDFGRAVVRALRQTMPPPQGTYGTVAVRLILTENGDLKSVDVLEKSGTSLDQSVVFATKQTYFPLPPYRSTVADRTFYIRYVYRRG